MSRVTVIETNLSFSQSLELRSSTDYFVIHHAASAGDISAADIHQEHQALGWAGCGYHYVIRYSGAIERGRPRDTVGAHAYGVNECSVGVVLAGNFMAAEPTAEQMNSLAILLADLCDIYGLKPVNIIGHREVADLVHDPTDATDCPGDRLYAKMDEIKQKVQALRS
jgi:N-acetylmuramoyl-L-alanine amidase